MIEAGLDYIDPGAIASDSVDGELTGSLEIQSDVDAGAIGTYTVFFNVTDSSGNKADEQVRLVQVVDRTPPVSPCLAKRK